MMVSGPAAAFEQVAPVLNAISPTVVRCGERLGDGQAIKMLNNSMNAGRRLATLEVVAMGRKQGLSLAAMTEAINQSTGRSRISQVALPALLAGKASSDFALPLMIKDVDQALHLSMKAGAPLPIAGLARALLQIGVNTVGPNARLEDMIGLIESMAATRLRDEVDRVEIRRYRRCTGIDAAPRHRLCGFGCHGRCDRAQALDCSCKVHVHDVRDDALRELEAAGAVVAPTCHRWHAPAT